MHMLFIFQSKSPKDEQKSSSVNLWSKSTDWSNLRAGIVIGNIILGWNHNIAVGSIREGVAIGLVQVTVASRVVRSAVGEVRDACRWGLGCGPARLQGCTGRVCGVAVHWIAIKMVPKLGLWRGSSGTSKASSRYLHVDINRDYSKVTQSNLVNYRCPYRNFIIIGKILMQLNILMLKWYKLGNVVVNQ